MFVDAAIQGVEEFTRRLKDAERDQVPFATAQALTATAWKIRSAWQGELKSRFDKPTPWITSAPRVERANKQGLEAKVFMAGSGQPGRSPVKVIDAHAGAGERGTKGIERVLQSAGILQGRLMVPGLGAKLDARGNLLRSEVKLLANVAQQGAGEALPQTGRRRRKARSAAFLSPLGVMERSASGELRSVAIFVDGAKYEQRADFPEIGAQTFQASYASEFERALARALETAR